jgi:type VI secretion system protein ImpF
MTIEHKNLTASILDRLIDSEPGILNEPVQFRLMELRQIRAMVIRDLENLLNTRRNILPPPPEFVELNRSIMVYGLGDFTSQSPKSHSVRRQLHQDIEKTIALFEPRLRNVKVQIEEEQEGRSLRFRINAMLVIEPESEPVQFDTYFDINRGEYMISK